MTKTTRFLRRLAAILPLVALVTALPAVDLPSARPHTWRVALSAGVAQAPGDFRLMGASWKSSGPQPESVQTRVFDGTSWGDWTDLELRPTDEGPDLGVEDRGRIATAPLWVGRARKAEIRFGGPSPRGAALEAVDPGADPVRPAIASASAEAGQPQIISRSQWGADESMRRASPRYASSVRVAFVHHTATSNDYAPGDSAAVVRSIYAYHVQSNGWDDIGYNFLVDRYGQVFEGRFGGIDKAVIGAHAAGFNTSSVGVSMIGSFGATAPPQAALTALQNVLAWKLDLNHVNPTSTLTYTSGGSNKYAEGTQVSLNAINGHRDVGQTDCPGDKLYQLLPNVRNAVAGIGLPKLYSPAASAGIFTPNGDGLADAVTGSVTASQSGAYTAQVLDSGGAVVRTTSGTGTSMNFTWDGKDAAGNVVRHGTYRLRWTLSANGAQARPAEASTLLANWPDGVFIKENSDPRVYRVESGRLRLIQSAEIFRSNSPWTDIGRVADGAAGVYQSGSRLPFREGTLIVVPNGRVYLVSLGTKRPFLTSGDFERGGYNWNAIYRVADVDAALLPDGAPYDPAALTHPSGTLVKGPSPDVYWVQGGTRTPIPSAAIFESRFQWNEIANISATELSTYPASTPVGFRDGSLISTPDGRIWLISGGQRRYIPTVETLFSLGFGFDQVKRATDIEASYTPPGNSV